MQHDPNASPPPIRPRPARPRLVGMNNQEQNEHTAPIPENVGTRSTASTPSPNVKAQFISPLPPSIPAPNHDVTMQPTEALELMQSRSRTSLPGTPPFYFTSGPNSDDVSNQSTAHLMQLSGMMRASRIPPQNRHDNTPSSPASSPTNQEEGYWPFGIQQTGALPIVNLYGREPFGRILPPIPPAEAIAIPLAPSTGPQPAWKAILNAPAAKVAIGLIIGIGLLFLVAHFVNLPTTIAILRQNLTTPKGIMFALFSGIAFLLAFSIRGVRWKLFLNPVGKVSTFKAIQLFLVGIFLNFLLPIRGGEVAKSLMLKRIANIPVSKSLPTVAMDKALDLMPALFIMAIVPFLGVQMDIKLWIVLALVGGLLAGLLFFIALAAWKRDAAIRLLQKMTAMLPKSLAAKIEGFATGFVDSLLMGASQPRIFVPAVLLTIVAVIFDGLFAFLAFWTIGFPISFGTAIFGYTVYNMFYILPTPPGQVGSNEAVGLLVFAGLLHLPADKVTAMFVFSHPFAALLMTITGMGCLSALGLKLSSAMKVQAEGETGMVLEEKERREVQGLPLRV